MFPLEKEAKKKLQTKISSWRPLLAASWYATGQDRGTYAQYNPLLYDGPPKICAQHVYSHRCCCYLTPKLVHRTMVKITVIIIIVCAIEQYNNNDQARIIVATRLLWYIVATSCVNWSYWVHLLNATTHRYDILVRKKWFEYPTTQAANRRIPPIILLHHHFINTY